MTDPERDPAVDAWLTSRRPLLRGIDDAHALEPPPELDRVILDGARRELRPPQDNKRRFFRNASWMAPMSIAATVLLSFLLVLQFNQYEDRQESSSAAANATLASDMTVAPVQAQAEAPASAGMADSVAATPLDQSAARSVVRQAASNASNAAPVAPAAVRAAPPPAYAKSESAAGAVSGLMADTAQAELSESVVSASRAAPSAAPLAQAPVASVAVAAAPAAAPASASASASAAASASASSDRAAAARAEIKEQRLPTAADWWARIEKLRSDGETAAAQREWEALHRAYPDFVAPQTAPAAPTPPTSPSR